VSTQTLGSLTLALLLLVAGANLLGQVAARLRQPKVIGEILAGIVLARPCWGSWRRMSPPSSSVPASRTPRPSSWVSCTTSACCC